MICGSCVPSNTAGGEIVNGVDLHSRLGGDALDLVEHRTELLRQSREGLWPR